MFRVLASKHVWIPFKKNKSSRTMKCDLLFILIAEFILIPQTFLLLPLLVCGLLCISRQHHPCVVCHWRQLCPGGACSRCRCHWTFPSCHWGLPAQLLWGSGVCERDMLDSDINQQSVIYKQSLFLTLMTFILSRHYCVVLGIFWYPDWKGPHQSHGWECWLW